MKVKCDLTAKDAKGTKEIFPGMPRVSRFLFTRRIPQGLTKRHAACAMSSDQRMQHAHDPDAAVGGDLVMGFPRFPLRSFAPFAVKRP
jgi:hypothetical protein